MCHIAQVVYAEPVSCLRRCHELNSMVVRYQCQISNAIKGPSRGDASAHVLTLTSTTASAMGTRHLIIVYWRGAYRIAQYAQFDGAPESAGVNILRFISDAANVDKLKASLDAGHLYTPSDRQRAQWNADTVPITMSIRLGADILSHVAEATQPVPIVLDLDFVAATVMCEFAYVVDLDLNTFEVFANLDPESIHINNSRFKHLTDHATHAYDKTFLPPGSQRAPELYCLSVWPLNELPTETAFLKRLET